MTPITDDEALNAALEIATEAYTPLGESILCIPHEQAIYLGRALLEARRERDEVLTAVCEHCGKARFAAVDALRKAREGK